MSVPAHAEELIGTC